MNYSYYFEYNLPIKVPQDRRAIYKPCVNTSSVKITYLKSIGRTLFEQLNQISLLYGYHINNNSYLICNKTNILFDIFHRLRHYDQREDQPKQVI